MSHRLDLTGKTYGKLKVIRYVETRKTHAMWKCLCTMCEETTVVSAANLVSGNSTRCNQCGKRAFSLKEALVLLERNASGDTQKMLAKEYGCGRSTISYTVQWAKKKIEDRLARRKAPLYLPIQGIFSSLKELNEMLAYKIPWSELPGSYAKFSMIGMRELYTANIGPVDTVVFHRKITLFPVYNGTQSRRSMLRCAFYVQYWCLQMLERTENGLIITDIQRLQELLREARPGARYARDFPRIYILDKEGTILTVIDIEYLVNDELDIILLRSALKYFIKRTETSVRNIRANGEKK